MIAAGDARTTDRNPHFLTETGLSIDARREGQRVTQRYQKFVGEFLMADDVSPARRFENQLFGFTCRPLIGDDDCALDTLLILNLSIRRGAQRGRNGQRSKAQRSQ